MATPQSTTSHDGGDGAKKNLEQITFRFCAECSNMLYPKEDEDAHKLQFTCRTCQYTEQAASTCVFRNVLNNAAGETAGVTQDVGSDPTVGAVFSSASGSAPMSSSAFPSSSSCDSCSPALSTPPQAVVLCLCCGNVIACVSCGTPFYAAPSSSTTPSSPAASSITNDDFSCWYGTSSSDADDSDAAETTLDEVFSGGGGFGYDDLACLSDEYEFENGTEFGNRDENDVVFAH